MEFAARGSVRPDWERAACAKKATHGSPNSVVDTSIVHARLPRHALATMAEVLAASQAPFAKDDPQAPVGVPKLAKVTAVNTPLGQERAAGAFSGASATQGPPPVEALALRQVMEKGPEMERYVADAVGSAGCAVTLGMSTAWRKATCEGSAAL